MNIPQYSLICIRQDGSELFNQMGPIARFLQLLDDAGHDFIIDAIDIYLGRAFSTRRRWWRIVIGRPSATLGSFGEGDILDGR